jgi:hypothetical protein
MEEKILYNTLKAIGTGKEFDTAPDREYLKALVKIGMIEMAWDNCLTIFGKRTLDRLKGDIEKW